MTQEVQPESPEFWRTLLFCWLFPKATAVGMDYRHIYPQGHEIRKESVIYFLSNCVLESALCPFSWILYFMYLQEKKGLLCQLSPKELNSSLTLITAVCLSVSSHWTQWGNISSAVGGKKSTPLQSRSIYVHRKQVKERVEERLQSNTRTGTAEEDGKRGKHCREEFCVGKT